MTPNEMLASCLQWTKVSDKAKRLVALKKAYRWAVRRVFNSEDGPDLLSTIGEELSTLLVTTKTLDIKALLAHDLLGFKKLWLKLPADVQFVGMEPSDTTDQAFIDTDSDLAANVKTAQGHPVYYDIINFGQARFSPALPAGAIIRVDYYRLAADIGVGDGTETDSSELAETPTIGEDLPAVFDDAVTSEAISLLFNGIDDDREASWHNRALAELTDALYIGKRVQGPTRTKGWRPRRRRFI
jgi:hypothetical protein